VELGIDQVWMHRSFGGGSVSDAATAYGREHGITVIDGGCPLMFGSTADPVHKVHACRTQRNGGGTSSGVIDARSSRSGARRCKPWPRARLDQQVC
jgi:hypothetical protein